MLLPFFVVPLIFVLLALTYVYGNVPAVSRVLAELDELRVGLGKVTDEELGRC